jgi:hypothetical protein
MNKKIAIITSTESNSSIDVRLVTCISRQQSLHHHYEDGHASEHDTTMETTSIPINMNIMI